MRISDWSSDVCSSDLGSVPEEGGAGEAALLQHFARRRKDRLRVASGKHCPAVFNRFHPFGPGPEHHNGYAQCGGCFLKAAGIGDDQRSAPQQPHDRRAVYRRGTPDERTAAIQPPPPLTPPRRSPETT